MLMVVRHAASTRLRLRIVTSRLVLRMVQDMDGGDYRLVQRLPNVGLKIFLVLLVAFVFFKVKEFFYNLEIYALKEGYICI